MLHGSDLGIDGHVIDHGQKVDHQRGIAADDGSGIFQFEIGIVHHIQEVDIVYLQRCQFFAGLLAGHPEERSFVKVITALFLQCFIIVGRLHINCDELFIREELVKEELCSLHVDLFVIQKDVIHQTENIFVGIELFNGDFPDGQSVAHVFESMQSVQIHLLGFHVIIHQQDQLIVRNVAKVFNIGKQRNVTDFHKNFASAGQYIDPDII